MEINLRRGAFFNLFGDKIMDGRIFLFSCLIIFLFLRYKGIWSQLPRLYTRLFIFSVFFLDAYFGLLFNEGFLNIFNQLTGNRLPSQKGFIWLIQILQAISAGFGFVKIAFDDLPKNLFRTISISLTPVFLLFVLWLVCDALITGRNTSAIAYLDVVQISTSTLRWAATYLSIAVALTLTYRVQRYGNFAQSEYFMLGMYVAMAIIWTDYFLPLTIAPADGVLVWSVLAYTLIAAFFVTGLVGLMIDRLVYKDFRKKKASPQVMMIASLGVALILRAIVWLRYSSKNRLFEPDLDWRMTTETPIAQLWKIPTYKMKINFGNNKLDEGEYYTSAKCEINDGVASQLQLDYIPSFEFYKLDKDCVTQLETGFSFYNGPTPLVIFGSVFLLLLLLKKTRLGRRMRAVADNPELAASSGINVERIHGYSAFLSAGLCGIGGAAFAMTVRFSPVTAFTLLLPSFAVIVLGTIGSIPGAIVSSLIIGFIRASSTPILSSLGQNLGRSNYSSFEAVTPYVFLIAILLIMPEGIGNAYEKWKINRLRKSAEENSPPSKNIGIILSVLFGWIGLHNLQQKKTSRFSSMASLTGFAYLISKITNFIDTHSFSKQSSPIRNEAGFSYSSNFEMRTGRDDWNFLPTDSQLSIDQVSNPPSDIAPYLHDQWRQNTFDDMNNSWADLMNYELVFLDLITSLGDLIWPTVPILIWILALVEGYYLYTNRKEDPLLNLNNYLGKYINPLFEKLRDTKENASITRIIDIRTIYNKIPKLNPKFDKNLFFLLIPFIFVNSFLLKFVLLSSILWFSVSFFNKSDEISIIENLKKKSTYGREGPFLSNMLFGMLLILVILIILWLPVADFAANAKLIRVFNISNIILSISIFILMGFCLNLHTGITGMVNFGIIFFVAIGAVAVGVLTGPVKYNGYDWPIFWALFLGLVASATFGWMLAYPTARLRTDYFAIVTISLGEILRVLLTSEPIIQSYNTEASWSSPTPGVSQYPMPLEKWWFCGDSIPLDFITSEPLETFGPRDCETAIGATTIDQIPQNIDSMSTYMMDMLSLEAAAPYVILLSFLSLVSVIAVWVILKTLLNSPWGRILRSIREDEEVAQHHGHDVLTYKASSLALGAAIAALAGAFWAWQLRGFQPTFMSPATTTFLVWAAFIIGGSGNNKGIIIGSSIIILSQYIFRILDAGQSSSDLPLHDTAVFIDEIFRWLVIDYLEVVLFSIILIILGIITKKSNISEIGIWSAIVFYIYGTLNSQYSIEQSFSDFDADGSFEVIAEMAYVNVLLVGVVLLLSLKYNPKGILPEVPKRPERPEIGGDSS